MGTVIRAMLRLIRYDDVLLWEAPGVRKYSLFELWHDDVHAFE